MKPEERLAEHEEIEATVATFDMDNMPSQTHRWVDRGVVMSCEGANHPNHRHFKRLVRK
jgi:hypothetical protein